MIATHVRMYLCIYVCAACMYSMFVRIYEMYKPGLMSYLWSKDHHGILCYIYTCSFPYTCLHFCTAGDIYLDTGG